MDSAKNVMATIVVVTYNQEEYIEQALRSIVSQETNFVFEVIVRDDASTDNTGLIVDRLYQEYPDVIIPVIHTYNHFSEDDYSFESVREYIHGKYVAYCEGDDFWTDVTKLQKEVDILENNKDCCFVAHKEQCVDADGNWMDKFYPIRDDILPSGGGKIFPNEMAEILFTVSLYPFQTASYLVTYDTFMKCIDVSNPLVKISKVYLDIRLLCESLLQGSFYYIDECLGAYRYCARGSYSADIAKDEKKARDFEIMLIRFLSEYDVISKRKFHKYIRLNFEYKYVDAFLRKDLEMMLLIHKNHSISLSRIWGGKVSNIVSIKNKIYWTIAAKLPRLAIRIL